MLNEKTVCVLISCMYQEKSIIERTHVQSHVVVVNQCDEDSVEEWDFSNYRGKICHAKFISTRERGLSRSRNMAIRNSIGDICLICDDDEELTEEYEKTILDAYISRPHADVISFAFDRDDKNYSGYSVKHNVRSLLKTSSVEITFCRDAIINKGIFFDEKMGSGSGNGPGEENMFLITCRRNGMQLYYEPKVIGRLLSADSQWFNGFTAAYFENYGWAMRRILGPLNSLLFFVYWVIAHHSLYKNHISVFKAINSYCKGWKSKR